MANHPFPKGGPLLLTHICKHWRSVAVESHQHWHWLKFHPNSVAISGSQLRSLTEVLRRAQGGSLNLQIDVPLFDHAVPPIFDSLVKPFSRSLTRLTIHDAPVRQLSRLPLGLFPKLERLALLIRQESRFMFKLFFDDKDLIRAFEDAPALRYVALASGLNTAGVTVSLPYPQLTHLMYIGNEGTYGNFLMQDLPTCKELRWLAADLTQTDVGLARSESWDTIPPRSMANIESLSLTFWGAGPGMTEYPEFFTKTHFLYLKALRLEGRRMDFLSFIWPIELLNSFLHKLEHEFTQLEYLSVCHSNVSYTALNRTLAATPRLTTLDLQIYEDFENVFEVLTLGPEASKHLLPCLQTLVLEVSSSLSWKNGTGETINPLTFGPFLESRLCPGSVTSTLQKIIVYGIEDEQLADERPFIQIIQGFVSQGLLELERRNVQKRRGNKDSSFWMDRDPWLSDWAEASLAI